MYQKRGAKGGTGVITRKPAAERGSNWRQPSTRRLLFDAATLLLSLGLGVAAAGCGGTDRAEGVFAPVDGTESAYCDTYRAWQVHELDGGTGDDQPNPAAFRAYWKDYLEFNKTSLQQAPSEIRDEWIVSDRAIRTVLTPVLEKYDFDVQRIAKEGTAVEKALGEPTPEAQKAQDAIHAYEDRVCGVATPPAANVAFKADTSSQSYCAALSDFNRGFEKVASSRFDPGVMRSVFTADSFTESLDELEETAPDDIAAYQEAVSEWFRSSWSDVVAEYDYDIRRIWLDGTPEDRAVFTFSHPDVLDHDTRLTAYEEQVCAE
jgi:hypothetical protein